MTTFLVQGYPLRTKKVSLTSKSGTSIGLTSTGTVALYRVATHGYTVGYTVSVSNCSTTAWNTVVTITSVTSAGSFRAVKPTGATSVTAAFYANRLFTLPEAYHSSISATRITHSTSGAFARAANAALITVYTPGNAIRFTQGGSNPNASSNVGHPIEVGSSIRLEGEVGVNTFRFTQFKGSTAATVNVTPYLLDDR